MCFLSLSESTATAAASPSQNAWRLKQPPAGDASWRPCGISWLRSRTQWAMESAWSWAYPGTRCTDRCPTGPSTSASSRRCPSRCQR
eukprot:4237466-Pleurochrysis_carterae.AAC.1